MSDAHRQNAPASINRNTPLDELPQFLTVAEIGRYFDVGKTSAYEYARQHGIRIGRLIRVPRERLGH